MACAPVVMDQKSRFLAALSAATAFRIDGGKLLLLDDAGRVRVRLVPHGPRREGSSPTPDQPAASSLPLAATRSTVTTDRVTVDIQLDGRAYRGCGDALAP